MIDLTALVDAMCKVSEIEDSYSEIKRLQTENVRAEKECGSCYHWMTRKCPRETNTNKVSCGQPICSSFVMQEWTKKFIESNKEKIKKHQEFISNS